MLRIRRHRLGGFRQSVLYAKGRERAPRYTVASGLCEVFCFNMSDGKVTSYSAPFLIGSDVRTLTLVNDQIGRRAYDTVRAVPEGKIHDRASYEALL
jgi:hypothetical protein